MNPKFKKFLHRIGYSESEIEGNSIGDNFTYIVSNALSLTVKYIYTPPQKDIYRNHSIFWNRNTEPFFIAVSDDNSYVINTREKPDSEQPLKKYICIKSFDYGINSECFQDIDLGIVAKDSIDSSYFFDFIIKNRKKVSR